VDFSCGLNDFSQFMKEKLDKVGKKCNFKNYDIIRPKNSFCFEKRDWMTVRPKELPHGSKLVWIFSLQLKLLRIPILIICNVAQNYDSNRP
jgi:hypothetical protein